MLETARGRIVVVLFLLCAQAALFPLFAVQPVNEEAWVLADEGEFVSDPEEYLGDRVESEGIVQETEPIVVNVETTSGTHRVTVVGTSLAPERGDTVRVYGTLIESSTIEAIDAFVVPQRGRWYAWGISFFAGLWVLSRLLRHWTVDRSTLGFRPRDEPISMRELLRSVWPPGGSTDA
ncbi:hypothetical protein [Halobellus ordinarius]|uniref:hypothetical protein n=1 Tax=Halobellus ordinarius TaxID=3075120 RepID=UPI0028807F17|nr:hypothetical protein [Halobellus sp. ZY16]